MVIAIVVLGIACAELAGCFGVLCYKYYQLKNDIMNNVSSMVVANLKNDDESREFKDNLDLSYPNTEGGF